MYSWLVLLQRFLKALSRYKVIYVNGPNLTTAAASKLVQWLYDGGSLYTSGGGLRFDESNQPLTATDSTATNNAAGGTLAMNPVAMNSVLGLKSRGLVEMWWRVELYKATALELFGDVSRQIAAVPEMAAVRIDAPLNDKLEPIVGREILTPAEGTETLARFADGGAAVTRHKYGAGTVWVVGLFPGLEYSAPLRAARYDMSRDLSQMRRSFITLPCQGRVWPIVDCDDAAVEGVLLRNDKTGKLAVTLMNWTYRVADANGGGTGAKPTIEFVPRRNLRLRIRGTGKITEIRSVATGKTLAASYADRRTVAHSATA